MENRTDIFAKAKKVIVSLLIFSFFSGIIYAGYLFYLFKKLPDMKTKVAALYGSVMGKNYTGGENLSGSYNKQKKEKVEWVKISYRTTDKELSRITMKQNVKETNEYAKLLNSNSVKLLKMISGYIAKEGGTEVISKKDEQEIKQMFEQMIDAYKYMKYDGIEELEKEIGKL